MPCDHLAGRAHNLDYQVWVAQGEKPLPQRILLTYTRAAGEPQFWARFTDWNLSPEVSDSVFAFAPPDGAQRIVFAPRPSDAQAPSKQAAGQKGAKK